jgi:transcriptional regulator with XRE-family HTH domain
VSKLRNTRLNSGLTLQQIADKTGLARITIYNAEKDITVSYVSAVRIVSALNELSGKNYSVEELEIRTAETKDAS